MVSTLAAPRRGRRRRGKHARLTGADPDPRELPATRATAVRADPLAGEAEAEAWLAELTRDPEARDAFAADALVLVNSALHAQRAATMDPSVNDLGAHDPVATRIGWGEGDQLAAGKWTKAVDAPPDPGKRVRRAEALRPRNAWRRCSEAARTSERARRSSCAPASTSTPALARGGPPARHRGAGGARRGLAKSPREAARGSRRDPGARARGPPDRRWRPHRAARPRGGADHRRGDGPLRAGAQAPADPELELIDEVEALIDAGQVQ